MPFPLAFPAPASEVDIERINTVLARHTPVTVYPMIDLTAEGGPEIVVMNMPRVQHTEQARLITGKQTYDATLDKMFPIRDPANPARVHPDYADPDDPTRCAANVHLQGVQFLKNGAKTTKWGRRPQVKEMDETALWNLLTTYFDQDHRYGSRSRTGVDAKRRFIAALQNSCRDEIEACLQGKTPPSSSRGKVCEVTAPQCDSAAEA